MSVGSVGYTQFLGDLIKKRSTVANVQSDPGTLQEGDIIVTDDYAVRGDGGGNRYIYHDGVLVPKPITDPGFNIDLDGSAWLEAVDQDVARIAQFGGDVQAALDSGAALVEGRPGSTYEIDAPVVMTQANQFFDLNRCTIAQSPSFNGGTDQSNISVKAAGCTVTRGKLTEIGPTLRTVFVDAGADGSAVSDLEVVGTVNSNNFIPVGQGQDAQDQDKAVQISGKACTAKNIRTTGKPIGVMTVNGHETIVDTVHLEGFQATDPGATSLATHSGVVIKSSDDCTVANVKANDCGSLVSTGSTPNRLSIDRCSGTNFWDNGIYVSSGEAVTCTNVQVKTVRGGPAAGSTGSGIKIRGNGAKVSNCEVEDSGTGITVSPRANGDTAYGQVVSNNTITNVNFGITVDNTPSTGRCFAPVISGNNVEGYVVYGIYLLDVEAPNLNGNNIEPGTLEGRRALQISGSGDVTDDCTADDLTDTFTYSGGTSLVLAEASQVRFAATTLPGNIVADKNYYAINVDRTAGTFQVSETKGGTKVSITSTGTGVQYTENKIIWDGTVTGNLFAVTDQSDQRAVSMDFCRDWVFRNNRLRNGDFVVGSTCGNIDFDGSIEQTTVDLAGRTSAGTTFSVPKGAWIKGLGGRNLRRVETSLLDPEPPNDPIATYKLWYVTGSNLSAGGELDGAVNVSHKTTFAETQTTAAAFGQVRRPDSANNTGSFVSGQVLISMHFRHVYNAVEMPDYYPPRSRLASQTSAPADPPTGSTELWQQNGLLLAKVTDDAGTTKSHELTTVGVTPLQFGAIGDGVTDDTTAVQAALDAGEDVVNLDGKSYLIASTLTLTAPVTIMRGELIENTIQQMVNCATASGSRFEHVTFTGKETAGTFTGKDIGTAQSECAININSASGVEVVDCVITGKGVGIYAPLSASAPSVIRGTFTGIAPNDGDITNANAHVAFSTLAADSFCDNCDVRDYGSAMTVGSSAARPTFISGRVENAWDNGIYFSSAQEGRIAGNRVIGGRNGIKARGSRVSIDDNKLISCVTGIDCTGQQGQVSSPYNDSLFNFDQTSVLPVPGETLTGSTSGETVVVDQVFRIAGDAVAGYSGVCLTSSRSGTWTVGEPFTGSVAATGSYVEDPEIGGYSNTVTNNMVANIEDIALSIGGPTNYSTSGCLVRGNTFNNIGTAATNPICLRIYGPGHEFSHNHVHGVGSGHTYTLGFYRNLTQRNHPMDVDFHHNVIDADETLGIYIDPNSNIRASGNTVRKTASTGRIMYISQAHEGSWKDNKFYGDVELNDYQGDWIDNLVTGALTHAKTPNTDANLIFRGDITADPIESGQVGEIGSEAKWVDGPAGQQLWLNESLGASEDLGETNVLGTQAPTGNNGAYAFGPYTAATSGNLRTISFYVNTGAITRPMRLGVYTDNAGYPDQLVGETAEFSATNGQWHTVEAPGRIETGQVYWIAMIHDIGGSLALKQTGTGKTRFFVANPYGPFPTTYPGGATPEDASYSAYATFGKGGWTPTLEDVSLYSHDGTLSEARTVNMGANKIDFLSTGGSFSYVVTGNGLFQLDAGGSGSNMLTVDGATEMTALYGGNSCQLFGGTDGSSIKVEDGAITIAVLSADGHLHLNVPQTGAMVLNGSSGGLDDVTGPTGGYLKWNSTTGNLEFHNGTAVQVISMTPK